ncbi:MAG TPA: hypothetical protein VG099_25445, partial [Gemmataceae bacterium]|nr:hypothetical protein [Gemmataceae bacterium]
MSGPVPTPFFLLADISPSGSAVKYSKNVFTFPLRCTMNKTVLVILTVGLLVAFDAPKDNATS